MEEGVYRQLRSVAHTRESVLRHQTASQRALRANLDDGFPELRGIFPSLKSRGLRALLAACPFPDDGKGHAARRARSPLDFREGKMPLSSGKPSSRFARSARCEAVW